jgi:putative DNA primase/helicase
VGVSISSGGEYLLESVVLADVAVERVTWLWQGRIPLGALTLMDGDPGLGKSLITLDLVARVTTGQPMPDESPGLLGGAVLLSAEDDLAATIRPRLAAAGADMSRVLAVQTVRRPQNPIGDTHPPQEILTHHT